MAASTIPIDIITIRSGFASLAGYRPIPFAQLEAITDHLLPGYAWVRCEALIALRSGRVCDDGTRRVSWIDPDTFACERELFCDDVHIPWSITPPRIPLKLEVVRAALRAWISEDEATRDQYHPPDVPCAVAVSDVPAWMLERRMTSFGSPFDLRTVVSFARGDVCIDHPPIVIPSGMLAGKPRIPRPSSVIVAYTHDTDGDVLPAVGHRCPDEILIHQRGEYSTVIAPRPGRYPYGPSDPAKADARRRENAEIRWIAHVHHDRRAALARELTDREKGGDRELMELQADICGLAVQIAELTRRKELLEDRAVKLRSELP